MGYTAQPTPEMGEYHVEVRSESFYISGEDAYGKSFLDRPKHGVHVYLTAGDSGQGTAEFLIEDIAKIRAALDQVERVAFNKRLPTD